MACSWAIAPVCAQDISQIAKSDPLIITGSIGTNNTYFHSSAGLGYMSPLSNSFFANLNFNIYGFSMPFSIYFSNDNLNFSYPQFSFNLSPSYKNFTAHIGQSSMPFSQYVLNMSFNGVGLEWRDKQFRASAFYGVLRRAVNDNPDDPTARIPQYRRYGWGISAGYSKGGNSIDLYFLRAYDSESSIDERWRTRVRPQENLVLGLKGQLSYKNFLSLAANVATSAFTADRESQQVMTDEARRFDKIFETRYTSHPPQFQCQSEPRYERHLLIVSYGSPRRRPGMISHSCARHQPSQAVGGRILSSATPSFCPVFSVAIFFSFSIISTAILVPLPPRHGTLLPCPQHFSLIYLVVSEENCNFVAYFKQSPETRRT